MLSPDDENRPAQTPLEARNQRARMVQEYFVHFHAESRLNHDVLIGFVEAIHTHLSQRLMSEQTRDFFEDLADEVPELAHLIEGTELTIMQVLKMIAQGEINLPVQPLSAHRLPRQEEIMHFSD